MKLCCKNSVYLPSQHFFMICGFSANKNTLTTSFRHSLQGVLLLVIFLTMLTVSEWHSYTFSEGLSGFHTPSEVNRAVELSIEHEAHHCPLCDFHISNTLLPAFNCIPGKEIVIAAVTFLVPTFSLSCQSFRLPESRGPPSNSWIGRLIVSRWRMAFGPYLANNC